MCHGINQVRLLVILIFLPSCPIFGAAGKGIVDSTTSYIVMEKVLDARIDNIVADAYSLPLSSSYTKKRPQVADIVLVKKEDYWKLGVVVSRQSLNSVVVMTQQEKKNFLATVPVPDLRELYPVWSMVYKGLAIEQFPEIFFDTIEQFSKLAYTEKNTVYGALLDPGSRCIVIGDLHGDFDSLARNLARLSDQLALLNNQGELAPNTYLVMLGDYADRGQYGVQCWYTLMNLVLKNPGKVFLIRGNHETEKFSQLKKYYRPFLQEWESVFSQEQVHTWWPKMLNIFEYLPLGVMFGLKSMNYYDFIFLCHGGHSTSWAPSSFIKSLLSQGNYVRTSVEDNVAQELMNNDFVGITLQEGIKKPRLHKEGKHITWGEMRKFLRRDGTDLSWNSDQQYCLRSILRGHQHAEGGVVQLMPMVDQWRKLYHGNSYEVDQYSVYGFTSSPTHYGKEDAFGILYAAPHGRWYLTPYIYPAKDE